MLKWTRIIAGLLAMALCFGSIALAEDEQCLLVGTVVGSKLHMRKEPATDGKIVATYPVGTKVDVLENNGAWCRVSKNGKTGYMMSKYLEITTTYAHYGWGLTRDESRVLTLYQRADEGSSPLTRFFSGARMELLEHANGWYKARLGAKIGYIQEQFIQEIDGEYIFATIAPDKSEHSFSTAVYSCTTKEYGAQMTLENPAEEVSGLSYTAAYPATGNGEADALISGWVKDQISAAKLAGAGRLIIDYESYQPDSRYVGVALFATLTDDSGTCETLMGLNIDLESGKVLRGAALLSDAARMGLMLEAKISGFFLGDTEGYSAKPGDEWLSDAVLAKDGLHVLLRAGAYLPLSLGCQAIKLSYREAGPCLNVEMAQAKSGGIDPSKPMIALTFDDGPSEYTDRLLDVLAQYGGHATFCLQGARVANFEGTVKRIVAEGSEIASHTWNHKKLTELSASSAKSQISRVEEAVNEIVPYDIVWLRPPYGSTNKSVRNVCKGLDMSIAFWSVDTLDWSTRSASKTASAILKGAKNGAIVLCHDLYSSTAEAIERVVPELINQGYQLVTLSEMFAYHKDGMQPGVVYSKLEDENNTGLAQTGK